MAEITTAHSASPHQEKPEASRFLSQGIPFKCLASILFALLFFLITSAPAVCWFSGFYPRPVGIPLENRKIVEKPASRKVWRNMEAWNAYIADNIPFRSQMLKIYLLVFENKLHSFKRIHLKGRDGHIFAAVDIAPEVQMELGIYEQSEYRMARAYSAFLSRQAYWRYYGAYYLATMPPTKAAVYKDFLPRWTRLSPGLSLGGHMRQWCQGSELNLVFLEEALREKAREAPVYSKIQDVVHWNGLAVLVATDKLAERLHRDIPWFSEKVSDFGRLETRQYADRALGRETVTDLVYKESDQFEVTSKTIIDTPHMPWQSSDIVHNRAKSKGTMLMASDSYFKGLAQRGRLPGSSGSIPPLVAGVQTFIMMHYAHLNFQCMEAIRHEYAPDIVLEAVAERAIAGFQGHTPPFFQKLAGLAAYALDPDMISPPSENAAYSMQVRDQELVLQTKGPTLIQLRPNFTVSPGKDGLLSIGLYIDAPKASTAILHYAAEGESFGKNTVSQPVPPGLNYVNFFIMAKDTEKPLRLLLNLHNAEGMYRILPCPSGEQAAHIDGEA